MDLVEFDEAAFARIRDEYAAFAQRLGFVDLHFIPVSATLGDNVVNRSRLMPWYAGPALLEHLEEVYVGADANLVDMRFPVQRVVRPDASFRGYSGTVASGVLRGGDDVVVLPSGRRTRVERIVTQGGDRAYAHANQAVTLTLADEVDAGRGDMLVHPGNVPRALRSVEAMVVWMAESALAPGRVLLLKHTTRTVRASCASIAYRVDPDTLRQAPAGELRLNDIGRASFTVFEPLFMDEYRHNRATGSFVLIDPDTLATVAAGMAIERHRHTARGGDAPVSRNITREATIGVEERAALLGQSPVTLWLTGLSGSGKSTLARELERRLVDLGRPCFVLDGDNLRHGLNRDLGFSPEDRRENIRRVAEVARLMNEAGVIVVTAFISPYREDRDMARAVVGPERFVEIHLSTPLAECERRDPKSLYRKARAGQIADFTGISAPYEAPLAPELAIDTAGRSVEECVERVLELGLARVRRAPHGRDKE